jgi:hypothetical protein
MGDEHAISQRCVRGILILSVAAAGCVSQPKMNAAAPIEKRSVFLGTSYQQNGKAIDPGDMLDKLEKEPEAADELAGYGAFATTAVILAGAGGALVGWPIGQAIGGEEDPLWVLAGVGGGLIAVSIPLAIVADNKVENAVDAHNRHVGAPTAGIRVRELDAAEVEYCEVPDVHRYSAHPPPVQPYSKTSQRF